MKNPLNPKGFLRPRTSACMMAASFAAMAFSHAAPLWWAGGDGNYFDNSWVNAGNTPQTPVAADQVFVGNGATVTIDSDLTIAELVTGRFTSPPPGQTGIGTINITGGTISVTNWLTAGRGQDSLPVTGTIHISGGTVNKTGAGQTAVGRQAGATGFLTISGNAIFNHGGTGPLHVGSGTGGQGTMNVQGGVINYSPTSGGEFHVGANGGNTGTMNQSGGTVNVTAGARLAVGSGAGSTGTFNLSGGNLNVGNLPIVIGRDNGSGTMTMTGGTVTKTGNTNVILGTLGTGSSQGHLHQSGGLFDIQGGRLVITEQNATSSVTLSGTAQLNAPLVSMAERHADGQATLNLNGGTLVTGEINGNAPWTPGDTGPGTSTIHFNGGLLRAAGNNSAFIANITNANIGNGGMRIDTNGFAIGTAQNFTGTGTGGLEVLGGGSLELNGNSSHTGITLVSIGSLYVNGELSNTSATSVEDGATLGGNGSLAGATTIHENGTISPGMSVGELSLEMLAILENGIFLAEITGAGVNDKLDISGAFIFDGILKLALDGYAPVLGDEFDLADFSGNVTGSWSLDISDAALSPGLLWDTSRFNTEGILQVIPEPSSALLLLLGGLPILRRRR